MRKILKGDKVRVCRGKYAGTFGEVSNVLSSDYINVEKCTIKKHVKATEDSDGGILDIPAKIHMSNVQLVDSKNKPVKVSITFNNGKKIRNLISRK